MRHWNLKTLWLTWWMVAICWLASGQAVTVAEVDAAIQAEVDNGAIPGAVVWIGRPGEVIHRKAYGSRQLEPQRLPMELDTIFDAASLTKVVATTTAVMHLWERGRIRLGDPVTAYLPKFQGGKSDISVRDLLTHFSGLRPDVDLKPVWSGEDTGIALAMADKPVAPPGRRFIYSDINFILLAEIVRAVSGQRVDAYVAQHLFGPLGMKDSGYLPATSLRRRIAPTERVDGRILHGVVHDPTTRFMGGVAGHAGLFSTAADLARFAEMILNGGTLDGVRVLQPGTVAKMTTPASPASQPDLRGLGWDIDSRFSSNRGELYPVASFGHTGFTGTSLWIDPHSRSYVILLTNSVHPQRKSVLPLRAKVATLAAQLAGVTGQKVAVTGYAETIYGPGNRRVVNRDAQVLNGIDVLAASGFASLKGKRVGLITNHTGLLRDGSRNVDAMVAAGVNVTAIFAPEHGIDGVLDQENIDDTRDRATNVP
ncbi:MAG: serine hydrolase, partial [Bryobacterales bacterium]|nr:serine hydrolase [Bryobacterales bacterium]